MENGTRIKQNILGNPRRYLHDVNLLVSDGTKDEEMKFLNRSTRETLTTY